MGNKNEEKPPTWVWRPQVGPQKSLIDCPVVEVFFGGSRGHGVSLD